MRATAIGVRRMLRGLLWFMAVGWLFVPGGTVHAGTRDAVRALGESAGERFTVRVSATDDALTFLRARGRGIPVAEGKTAPEKAIAFLRANAAALHLPDADGVVVSESRPVDDAGFEFVRLRQQVGEIPVRFGEMTVHLRDGRLTALHARTVRDAEGVGLKPLLTAEQAGAAAEATVAAVYGVSGASFATPRLELFSRGLLDGKAGPTRLAWMVGAQAPLLDAWIWVDALSGEVLFHLNQVPDGLDREVYDLNSNPGAFPGTLVGTEMSPPASPVDAVNVFEFTQDTYDYFLGEHGRDSFDGAGATMTSVVRFCGGFCPCPCNNAFWNGTNTLFGHVFTTTDDIVGHEWTHGVTQHTAGLVYSNASGALNESYSDIFGESIDLSNGAGYDPPTARWIVGDSAALSIGIRNMMSPESNVLGADPPRLGSDLFYCGSSDYGGVHTNSAIGNHAYALMVDGGTFNGHTISGIGLSKAGKIEYRALTQYLTPTSSFRDNYDALLQACNDLIGVAGITAGDCAEVGKALDSVEMYGAWPCTCGDGVLDAEEECDDGNREDGDCCSSLCQSAGVGGKCSDGNGCSNDDACQLVGPALVCVATEAKRNDCRGSVAAGSATLAIANFSDDGKDRLSFAHGKGVATLKSELGDPTTAATDYTFCLYKASQAATLHRIEIPGGTTCAGKPCWRETATGFKYRPSGGDASGVAALVVKAGASGKTKLKLKAKGAALAPPAIASLDDTLTAQVVSSSGVCWDAEFTAPALQLTAERFKDRGE